ncbi:MAG: molecular chaperone [Lachnospiraceae bacterium]|nr:molecular chaperone [Lachnospiraceae bacterium]
MEDNRVEQKEALETLVEFNERLVKNIDIVIKELSGARMDDTDKFLKSIIDAMNWEIAVMNGTMELLNEGKERINKEAFNQKIMAFGEAIKAKDDEKMAEALEVLLPEFTALGNAAKEVIG